MTGMSESSRNAWPPHALRTKRVVLDADRDAPRTIVAVGDVHGDSKRLASIVDHVRATYGAEALFVFLGDYVDRGDDSKGAIDLVRSALKEWPGSIAIAGNHDDYFSAWANGGPAEIVVPWLESGFMGGESCIRSFGLESDQACALPECYLRFVNDELTDAAQLTCPAGDFVFCHGGYDWTRQLEDQSIKTLHFGGKEFWYGTSNDFRVIFGHWMWDKPKVWPDRIGLDTGCPMGELSFATFFTHDASCEISYFSTHDDAGRRPYGTGPGISRVTPRIADAQDLRRLEATTF